MKKIITFVTLIVLIAAGVFVYRYYPVYNICKDMGNSIEFRGEIYLKKNRMEVYDPDSYDFLPESMLNFISVIDSGSFWGEYVDGVFHVLFYEEGIETAMTEFYLTRDGNCLLNIGQIIACELERISNETGLSLKWIQEWADSSVNFYLSEEQLAELLGTEEEVSDDEPEQASDKLFWLKMLRILHIKTEKIAVDENNMIVDGLNIQLDHESIPFYMAVEVWKRAEEKPGLIVPEEVDLSEEQVQFIKMILQEIAEHSAE